MVHGLSLRSGYAESCENGFLPGRQRRLAYAETVGCCRPSDFGLSDRGQGRTRAQAFYACRAREYVLVLVDTMFHYVPVPQHLVEEGPVCPVPQNGIGITVPIYQPAPGLQVPDSVWCQ